VSYREWFVKAETRVAQHSDAVLVDAASRIKLKPAFLYPSSLHFGHSGIGFVDNDLHREKSIMDNLV